MHNPNVYVLEKEGRRFYIKTMRLLRVQTWKTGLGYNKDNSKNLGTGTK